MTPYPLPVWNRLSPLEKQAVWKCLTHKKSTKEVALELGVNEQKVHDLLTAARCKAEAYRYEHEDKR